ncbi:hypothetical protein NDU88_001158 [Pleurodeles waltl]|uniref:Uncharacterized protein n=1 Tax=Pleurodeles waltl TaxID=8319 RepID=A0AAV7P7X7_PLEWA|nr:hypothetical protein NDU88_001158 [Pleurodeles waltl]
MASLCTPTTSYPSPHLKRSDVRGSDAPAVPVGLIPPPTPLLRYTSIILHTHQLQGAEEDQSTSAGAASHRPNKEDPGQACSSQGGTGYHAPAQRVLEVRGRRRGGPVRGGFRRAGYPLLLCPRVRRRYRPSRDDSRCSPRSELLVPLSLLSPPLMLLVQ